MKLFDRYNIEHNFPRGVFLSPIGEVPSLDIIIPEIKSQTLFVPVIPDARGNYELIAPESAHVTSGELLATGLSRVLSPCGGRLDSIGSCYVPGFGNSPAYCLRTDPNACISMFLEHTGHGIFPTDAASEHVLGQIRDAGIICANGRLLSDYLSELSETHIAILIANASPPEPDFNTPAAILKNYPEKVYAGLAILRHVLGATTSMLAYPWSMTIDNEYAEMWAVKTVQVSDKYPQYHPRTLLETLRRRRLIDKQQYSSNVVFDIQTLALVEQAVMANQPMTARIVTVAGNAADRPGHYLLPVGTAISDLLSIAQVCDDCKCVIAGWSLTGRAIDPTRTVVGPNCESFTVMKQASTTSPDRCTRCGRCIEFCPAALDPSKINELIEYGNFDKAQRYGLDKCLNCGLCSYCCSAGLKIHENIKMAKKLRQ